MCGFLALLRIQIYNRVGSIVNLLLEVCKAQGSLVGGMQLQYAILADAAQILPDGKFVIMGGGIEYINAPSFPTMNPSLALVVRITVDPQEVGREHQFRLELLKPDGESIPPLEGSSVFTPQAPITSGVVIPLSHMFVINLPGVVFPEPGKYMFRMFVDDHEVGEVFLYLQIVPSATQTSA